MATPIKMPQLGITMTEGTINRWLKQIGDPVKAGEVLAEIETDKINGEVEAPADEILRSIVANVGEAVPVTGVLGYVGGAGEALPSEGEDLASPAPPGALAAAQPSSSSAPAQPTLDTSGRLKITPIARRLASELGIDPGALSGSGPGGRIVELDVRRASEEKTAAAAATPAPATVSHIPAPTPTPTVAAASTPSGPEQRSVRERIPLTGMRRTIADRMYRSLQQSAQLTLGAEADATALVQARQQLSADAKASGSDAGPTYTDLLVKIAARALREHAMVNATLSGNEILILDDVHVGVAVALETGLIVPVVRHADRLGLPEISAHMRRLVGAARENKLAVDDVTGATFTITNLGMFDIDFFTPILNPPESAILGVGRIVSKVVPLGEETAVRSMMTLSLTFDHRVFDGAPAARFLQRIKRLIENPLLAL